MITLSFDDALILLRSPKAFQNSTVVFDLSQERNKLYLDSNDGHQKFFVDTHCSKKISFRISSHTQQDFPQSIPLMRVDFNGAPHTNPLSAKPDLPALFLPYVGRQFTANASHVHIHVPGYKPLAWALPLSDFNELRPFLSQEMQLGWPLQDLSICEVTDQDSFHQALNAIWRFLEVKIPTYILGIPL